MVHVSLSKIYGCLHLPQLAMFKRGPTGLNHLDQYHLIQTRRRVKLELILFLVSHKSGCLPESPKTHG